MVPLPVIMQLSFAASSAAVVAPVSGARSPGIGFVGRIGLNIIFLLLG